MAPPGHAAEGTSSQRNTAVTASTSFLVREMTLNVLSQGSVTQPEQHGLVDDHLLTSVGNQPSRKKKMLDGEVPAAFFMGIPKTGAVLTSKKRNPDLARCREDVTPARKKVTYP